MRPRVEASFDGWSVGSFLEGAEMLRELEQDGIAPDIARLSDEEETRLSVALAGTGAMGRRLLGGRCLLVCGWQGAHGRAAAARKLVRGGRAPARARSRATRGRSRASPARTCATTCSTAACSSRRSRPRRRGATSSGSTAPCAPRCPGLHVGCHVSHLYPTGASLYFTVLGRQEPDPVAQWRAAKDAATRAIVAAGGTITHHHAVGRDHAPYLGDEIGELGLELLRAVKDRCDPAGIMNPGKLLP